MLASKTFTNSDLVDGALSWNHGLNTVNVIPAWKDNEGIYRTIGDLFKVVDKDNVILSCNSAIEGTHTLYLTYETSIRIVTSDANLLLSFSEQQLIRPLSNFNSTNTQAVNRYKQLAYEVECYELDKLLGSAFYQDVSKNPANYTDLLNGCSFVDKNDNTIEHRGLKYVIAYLNYAKYVGESYINDTFTGLVQKIRTDSERISSGDIKRLQQEYREIAFNAFELIREYLYLNPETFPLWKNERKKDMKTNKKFYGINFRSDYHKHINMRTLIFLIFIFLANIISAQYPTVGKLPYKTLIQNYQGDTIWTKINGDTASIHTNLNFFNFDKTVLVNGDTIQGGSGTWPADSSNYASKSLLNDSVNALHNRTAVSQHIKASDTTRWASGGITPVSNILEWDAVNSYYTYYTSAPSGLVFYNTSDAPSNGGILKLNGQLLTNYLYSNGGLTVSPVNAHSGAASINTFSSGITEDVTGGGLYLNRTSESTTYDFSGALLTISDNPTTTGSISGSLIMGIVGSTERLRFDPRIKAHADSTAYVFDTHRELLSTDTLLTIKNFGANKFQVLYDGSVYSKGSIFKQGTDTLATQAYARSQGGGGGDGTVTTVSITTANGISGTVANATTTPEITILPDTINKYKTHTQSNADTVKLHNQIVNCLKKTTTTVSTTDSVWAVVDGEAQRSAVVSIAFGYSLSAYASGAPCSLTNSSAFLDFGSIDPEITLNSTGTWKITAGVYVQFDTTTISTNRTFSFKLREVVNTSSDLSNSATPDLYTGIVTSVTQSLGYYQMPITYYTTSNTTDKIQIWGGLSGLPDSGSIRIRGAWIVAELIY